MEPIAVDVILYGGYPQHFMQGRSWRINGIDNAAQIDVLDAEQKVIAVIAGGRWEAVGFRYTQPETKDPRPRRISRRSWREFKREVFARMN